MESRRRGYRGSRRSRDVREHAPANATKRFRADQFAIFRLQGEVEVLNLANRRDALADLKPAEFFLAIERESQIDAAAIMQQKG